MAREGARGLDPERQGGPGERAPPPPATPQPLSLSPPPTGRAAGAPSPPPPGGGAVVGAARATGWMVSLRLAESTVVQLPPLLPARLYCCVLCRSTIAELPGKNRRVSRVGE